MRITKKIREEAAQLCSACACHGEPISVSNATALLYGVDQADAPSMEVARVAVRAWDAAHRKLAQKASHGFDAAALRDDYAEAEALLRTGWTP